MVFTVTIEPWKCHNRNKGTIVYKECLSFWKYVRHKQWKCSQSLESLWEKARWMKVLSLDAISERNMSYRFFSSSFRFMILKTTSAIPSSVIFFFLRPPLLSTFYDVLDDGSQSCKHRSQRRLGECSTGFRIHTIDEEQNWTTARQYSGSLKESSTQSGSFFDRHPSVTAGRVHPIER